MKFKVMVREGEGKTAQDALSALGLRDDEVSSRDGVVVTVKRGTVTALGSSPEYEGFIAHVRLTS